MSPSIRRRFPMVLVLVLFGCESGQTPGAKRRAAAQRVAAGSEPEAPPPEPTAAPEPTPAKPSSKSEVEWKGNIDWADWDAGRSRSKRESKPMMVVVYADWCPKCRALGPVFADPELEKLAKDLVPVRQNHDDEPSWLQPYNEKYGGYVPRIFFFDADGKIREDVTSGHPRYPYFYAAQAPELLKRSMRTVIGS